MCLLGEFPKIHKFQGRLENWALETPQNWEHSRCFVSLNGVTVPLGLYRDNECVPMVFVLFSSFIFGSPHSEPKRECGQPQLNGNIHPCLGNAGDVCR